MSGIFNLDAPIWVFMGEVADIIILALLWWFCCLGIVTIGASTTSLYYVLGKKIRREQTYIVKDFFKSFRQNFKQSVPLSIIMSIAFVSLALYTSLTIVAIFSNQEVSYLKYLLPLTIVFGFEVINLHNYSWALLSRFEMTTRAVVKMAFVMTHRHLITTMWNLLVIAVTLYAVYQFPIIVIIAPSIIVLGQSYRLQILFTKYITASKESIEKNEIGEDELYEADEELTNDYNESEIDLEMNTALQNGDK